MSGGSAGSSPLTSLSDNTSIIDTIDMAASRSLTDVRIFFLFFRHGFGPFITHVSALYPYLPSRGIRPLYIAGQEGHLDVVWHNNDFVDSLLSAHAYRIRC